MDLRWQTLCCISAVSKQADSFFLPRNGDLQSHEAESLPVQIGGAGCGRTHHHRQTRLTTERGQIPLPYGGLHMAFTSCRVYSDAMLPATREGLNRKLPWQMRTSAVVCIPDVSISLDIQSMRVHMLYWQGCGLNNGRLPKANILLAGIMQLLFS